MTMHEELKAFRQRHPHWIWNRSDTHVILGVPQSLEAHRTVVEPGNSFSPGVGTFGVSVWLMDRAEGSIYAPEELPLDAFDWRMGDGGVPVLSCSWQAGRFNVQSDLFVDGHWQHGAISTFMTVTVRANDSFSREPKASDSEVARGSEAHPPIGVSSPTDASLYVVLRSFGAAGGPIRRIALDADDKTIHVNGAPGALLDTPPDAFGAVSYCQENTDIGQFLRAGKLPAEREVQDDSGWASAAAEYRLNLSAGQSRTMNFQFPHHLGHSNRNLAASLSFENRVASIGQVREQFVKDWRAEIGTIDLSTPDERFNQAFYCQLAHMRMATVYDHVRISNVSYPIWWLRDGVYVLNALNKGGMHEFAGRACRHLAERTLFGGFGAEGDGPGEGIWALSEHYFLTHDADFLQEIYPHITRRADLLLEMLQTTEPIRAFVEFGTAEAMISPFSDLACLPAEGGLICGRMDWHFPWFWVNAFACDGLVRAADMARAMGDRHLADKYAGAADALRSRLATKIPTDFGQNDRDVTGSIWPTHLFNGDEPGVREVFDRFWNTTRCPQGRHQPEKLWTYFEAGQAHNYMFLGQRERTWVSLEHFLTTHTAPGLYTYHEGNGDENSFGLWQRVRGWDRISFVTPHGWTGAELFLLLRDCMLHETADRTALVIGAGVPKAWMESGKPIGIANAPSHFGSTSWRLEGKRLTIQTARPAPGGYIVDLPGVELANPSPGCTISRNASGQWHATTTGKTFECHIK